MKPGDRLSRRIYRFDPGDLVVYVNPLLDPTGEDLVREVLAWDQSARDQLVVSDETLVGGRRRVPCRMMKRARAADLARPFLPYHLRGKR